MIISPHVVLVNVEHELKIHHLFKLCLKAQLKALVIPHLLFILVCNNMNICLCSLFVNELYDTDMMFGNIRVD